MREQSVLLTSSAGVPSGDSLLFRLRQPVSSGAASRGTHRSTARASVSVDNAVFPISFRPLNRFNNTVRVTAGAIDATLVFDASVYYEPYTLAQVFERLFKNAGLTVAVRFSPTTLGLSLKPADAEVRIEAEGTTAARALGLPTAGIVLPANTLTLLPNPVDLAGPRYLIVSSDLPARDNEAHDGGGAIAVIPVNASTGQMLVYDPPRPRRTQVAIDQLAQLRVRVTDEYNVPIDFYGVQWSMQLLFEFDAPDT